MRDAHPLEQAVGMAYYVSDADGIGGRLRSDPEAFQVRELEAFEPEPLDADTGGYPHVLIRVTLRDWETNRFAGVLSDRLGISRERVSWAGTKDKRATTTQLFTLEAIDPDALPDLDGVDITVLGRTGRPILFGDLAGNEFQVTVREPSEPENVARVTGELRRFGRDTSRNVRDDRGQAQGESECNGQAQGEGGGEDGGRIATPNYFGQQRFGSKRPITHEVGLAIVRGNWEEALLKYVGHPHEREPPDTKAAREYVMDTHDWTGALNRFPDRLGYERAMLHTLAARAHEREDGQGEATGRTTTAADYRSALESVPTNLQQLFVHAAQSYLFNRMLSVRLERGLPFHEPVAGDVVCFAEQTDPTELPVPDASRTERVTAERVHAVRRHCQRGRAFVTAPLVGTATDLGDGEPGEIERDVLADEGIELADFDLPGEFDSSGTRRPILLRTTLDVGHEPLELSFQLPPGSYATVVCREYLKVDPERL